MKADVFLSCTVVHGTKSDLDRLDAVFLSPIGQARTTQVSLGPSSMSSFIPFLSLLFLPASTYLMMLTMTPSVAHDLESSDDLANGEESDGLRSHDGDCGQSRVVHVS